MKTVLVKNTSLLWDFANYGGWKSGRSGSSVCRFLLCLLCALGWTSFWLLCFADVLWCFYTVGLDAISIYQHGYCFEDLHKFAQIVIVLSGFICMTIILRGIIWVSLKIFWCFIACLDYVLESRAIRWIGRNIQAAHSLLCFEIVGTCKKD